MNKRLLIFIAVLALAAMNAFGGVAFAKSSPSTTAHHAVTAAATTTESEGEQGEDEDNNEEEAESEAESEE